MKTKDGWSHSDPRIQQILFQIQAGREYRVIAEQFGISIQRVAKIRRRAGLPRRIQPAVD